MGTLRTDYTDDILAESNDRRKYIRIDNEDGTFSLNDVTEYENIGDSFGAVDINGTNQKVNDLNSQLDGKSIRLVDALPGSTEPDTIYLVKG